MFLEADAEVVRFDRHPSEQVRLSWCWWLERHGIDPKRVAVPGVISRSVEYRRIRYEGFKLNARGRRYFEGDRVAREVVVVQLEREPEPFPEVTA